MEDLQAIAERLFVTALGLDPVERPAYLSRVCHDSPGLKKRIEEMLKEDDLAGSFLKRPLFEHAPFNQTSGEPPTATEMACPIHNDRSSLSYIPQFQPGEILFDRFAIVGFIAKGGMGEVYEVQDSQLRGVHVALKTILSHFSLDPVMRDRFRREVLMAREVSHPNVCPIYDVFEWKRPEGPLIFLTMKLVKGETLATKLSRGGALTRVEALLITHQVVSALSATENAGILHRDIKPSNILLSESGDQPHAYVTDFGLARPIVAETTALTVGLAGTPGYVAPELFQGAPPSKASDVYSLGVVICQMLTGQSPGSIAAVLQDRKHDSLFPQQWRKVINKSLQPSIEARYKSITELAEDLPGLNQGTTTDISRQITFSRRRMIAVGAASLAAASGGVWIEWNKLINLFDPLPTKRFVALMAWPANASSASVKAILSSIADRLIRFEALHRDLVVFNTQDVVDIRPPILAPQDAGNALGANLALAASLQSSGETSHLQLQLLNIAKNNILRHDVLSFDSKEIAGIEEKASRAAIRMLNLPAGESPIQDTEELRRVSPEAFQAFSEGLALADKPNNAGLEAALLSLQRAVDIDPHFALGYAELAMTYVRRFNANGDRANLIVAKGNSDLALRYNPHSIKALLSAASVDAYSGKAKEALEYFTKALEGDPDNPQILLYQAQAFRFMNMRNEAEDLYRKIILKRPNYWPAYNELGYLLSNRGDHNNAAKAFAAGKAAAPNAALPQANLGTQYVFLSKLSKAKEECEESLKKSPTDIAYRTLGDIAFMDKDYRSARADYQSAAKLNPNFHDNWRDLADCDAMLGNQAGVKENYLKAAQALRDSMPENSGTVYEWATLAFYFSKVGQKAEADSALQKLGQVPRENLGARLMVIQATVLLGRKEQAMKLLLDALDDGLSPIQVDFSLDLKDLRNDPRYLSKIAKLKAVGSSKTVS